MSELMEAGRFGRGQNMDPWSMDPLFGPGPWIPYFFNFVLIVIFHFLFSFFSTILLGTRKIVRIGSIWVGTL